MFNALKLHDLSKRKLCLFVMNYGKLIYASLTPYERKCVDYVDKYIDRRSEKKLPEWFDAERPLSGETQLWVFQMAVQAIAVNRFYRYNMAWQVICVLRAVNAIGTCTPIYCDLVCPERVASLTKLATPTVKAIAKAIYVANDFEALPVLADALEEAGCTDKYILSHCRKKKKHYKGCWVVGRCIGNK